MLDENVWRFLSFIKPIITFTLFKNASFRGLTAPGRTKTKFELIVFELNCQSIVWHTEWRGFILEKVKCLPKKDRFKILSFFRFDSIKIIFYGLKICTMRLSSKLEPDVCLIVLENLSAWERNLYYPNCMMNCKHSKSNLMKEKEKNKNVLISKTCDEW